MNTNYSPKQERSLQLFRSGYNCAQSVVEVFQEDTKADKAASLALSAGFGGGMGRLQLTCGALTGAFMAAGQFNSCRYADNDLIKQHSYRMIQSIHNKFVSLNKYADCMSLLKLDLNNAEERKRMKEDHLEELVCEKCVLTAVAILEKEFQTEISRTEQK